MNVFLHIYFSEQYIYGFIYSVFKVIFLHGLKYYSLGKMHDIQLDQVGPVKFEGNYRAFP